MSDNDAIGNFLGPFGKWQMRSALLIFLVKIPSAWFMACLIFTAKSPTPGEIFCKPPLVVDVKDAESWIAAAHFEKFSRIENEEHYNFCHVNENAVYKYLNSSGESTTTLVECSAFEHRPTFYSLIHQYDLFCSREALVALTQSFHLLGVLIGGIIAFYMLKIVSPRKTMLIGMITQIVAGIATGYAPIYELHLFFRCSVAATCSMMCCGIMIDITAGKYRVSAICLFEQFWSVGVILLPAVSSWWESWRLVYVSISLPTLTLIILHYWIPDSPRWLLKNGKVKEAKTILLEAAKVNGKKDFSKEDLDKQLNELADVMSADSPEPTLLSIWRTPFVIQVKLFIAHIGWSVYLMLYFGYLLNVRAMGRKYLEVNTVIAGISEIVGTFIALYLILNTSNKWLWTSLLNIITSFIALSANFLPDTVPSFHRMVIYMATATIAKMTVSTSLVIFITSMGEIVSKDKKKTCNYSGVTCSRTLVMIAPFIGYCVIYGQLVPQTIMSIMNICVSLLIAIFIRTPRTIPMILPAVDSSEKQISEHFIGKKIKNASLVFEEERGSIISTTQK